METNVVVNQTNSDIQVYIDTVGPNLYPIKKLLDNLVLNYTKIEDAVNNVYVNSSKYLNQSEIDQLTFLKTLSSGWQETYHEVNTIQQDLSATWQETVNEVNIFQALSASWKIVDAGYF